MNDSVGFLMFAAATLFLGGFVAALVIIFSNRRREEGGRNAMENNLYYNTYANLWNDTYRPPTQSDLYEWLLGNHQSRLGQRNQTPDLTPPHKEPEPPKTDRDFIRFGPKL